MTEEGDSESAAKSLLSNPENVAVEEKNSSNSYELTKNCDTKEDADLKSDDVNDIDVNVTETAENSEQRTSQVNAKQNELSHGTLEGATSCDNNKTDSEATENKNKDIVTQTLQNKQNEQDSLLSSSQENATEEVPGDVIMTQPMGMSPLYPPQLEGLIDCMQVVIHKANFRHDIDISETAVAKYEVINEARRMLFYAEKEPTPLTDQSFRYILYDKNKQPAIEVYNPLSSTCFLCHSSFHCFKKYKFQAVIFTPPGIVAGFVRRSNTCLLQEFEILSPQEDVLLLMRGGPIDLELYSTDLDTGLGRMAIHGWHGIMHEVKRSGGDIGLTFPFDLDVRVKAILVGAVFAIDWLYSTRNGTRS